MSERSQTIWKLLVTFAILSLIAGGFSLYPKNKKYGKIVAKSVRTFGTDKELENVIEYLEERLKQRGFYQFSLQKQPMRLTNVFISRMHFLKNWRGVLRTSSLTQREFPKF